MDLNRITLIGRLGKDPISINTKTGKPMCILKIATSEMRKLDTGSLTEQTEWHDVLVFGKSATNCLQYLKKGREVWVEGKLEYKNRLYKGVQVRDSSILASSVGFLGRAVKTETSNISTDLTEEKLPEDMENHMDSIKLEGSTTGQDPVNTSLSTLLEKGLEDTEVV